MEPKISVILNCYKRFDSLPLQLQAIENQTIKPHEILIWVNASEEYKKTDKKIFNNYKTVISNYNFGVWPRFYHAMNTTGDYVCLFDDDTIPGKKWFENCMTEMNKQEGLYGTRGLVFSNYNYDYSEDIGWHSGNETTRQVDIVGHAWFFPKKFASAFCRETETPSSSLCGEDIHFSYSIQKYMNGKTFVPPHPVTDLEMWGSIPKYGMHWGCDKNAISTNPDAHPRFQKALASYKDKGFKLLNVK
jgi:hypothetical protein